MQYLYGEFSDNQIIFNAKLMHNDIHKLLIYKDKEIEEKFFKTDFDYNNFFNNLLVRFGGLNKLLGEPKLMISFMSTLQAAKEESDKPNFNYKEFRRLIFDAHGYLTQMFGDVRA